MKTADEIIKDAKNNGKIENYNLLELFFYMSIERILKMYYNRQITKEEANARKILASKKYNDLSKQYEFEKNMFQEHIQNLKDTEFLRTKLRKILKGEVTEETLAEALNIALEIIEKVFKEEF